MKIVKEECDETIYWIEMLTDSGQIGQRLVTRLLKEADEILAMVVASIKTVRIVNRQSSIVNRQLAQPLIGTPAASILLKTDPQGGDQSVIILLRTREWSRIVIAVKK